MRPGRDLLVMARRRFLMNLLENLLDRRRYPLRSGIHELVFFYVKNFARSRMIWQEVSLVLPHFVTL